MLIDLSTWELWGKIQRMRRKTPERALLNLKHTCVCLQHPTLASSSAPLQPERRKLHWTISLCCKTHAETHPAWSDGAFALLPVTSSRKQRPPRDHWQICSISRLSVEVSLLHEVILSYTKPHCTRTAVCTMQSAEGSLPVLVMSRLYCIFFCAYVLNFCVLILILAAREIKEFCCRGKKVIKGIYLWQNCSISKTWFFFWCVCNKISTSPSLIHGSETPEVKHLQCLNRRSGSQV